jgi:F-type H+-transporting ATPase subunit f
VQSRGRTMSLTHSTAQSSGQGAGLAPLVAFYSKLPKGAAAAATSGGIKGRFFDGKNASVTPFVATIFAIFGLGYTIDYQSASGVFTRRLVSDEVFLFFPPRLLLLS